MQKISFAEAVARLMSSNTDYMRLFGKDAFDVGIYRPVRVDKQTPHTRDELYIIAAGTGDFTCGGATSSFATGDVIFVPARVEHRFLKFSPDFATWVLFVGETSKQPKSLD